MSQLLHKRTMQGVVPATAPLYKVETPGDSSYSLDMKIGTLINDILFRIVLHRDQFASRLPTG
jgi:hypothetical protein